MRHYAIEMKGSHYIGYDVTSTLVRDIINAAEDLETEPEKRTLPQARALYTNIESHQHTWLYSRKLSDFEEEVLGVDVFFESIYIPISNSLEEYVSKEILQDESITDDNEYILTYKITNKGFLLFQGKKVENNRIRTQYKFETVTKSELLEMLNKETKISGFNCIDLQKYAQTCYETDDVVYEPNQ